MTQLSSNFKRDEFKCNCGECKANTVDAELLQVLQRLRDEFGKSITITSGNRCKAYNEKVGGSDKSQHLLGRAADIVVSGANPHIIYEWLDSQYPNQYGLGRYDDFTHIDTRDGKARWRG